MNIEKHFLENTIGVFKNYRALAEKSFAQLNNDKDYHYVPDAESNSIAVIIQHMSGNMISRWTDFLTTDGEKPTRNRDAEFDDPPKTRAAILDLWDAGWKSVFTALEGLSDTDMTKTVTIRGEEHSVMQAINRQVAHYTYHIGQIVLLARHYAGANWKSVTVPKNKSKEFNADVASGKKSQRKELLAPN